MHVSLTAVWKRSLCWAALAVPLSLGASCAPADTSQDPVVSIIEPVVQTGTLYGQVDDAATFAPLVDVDVQLLSGGGSTTTDEDGAFTLTSVPTSRTLAVGLSKDGYLDAVVPAALRNESGNLVQNNAVAFVGPVQLLPASAAPATLRVVDGNGNGVAGATVSASVDAAFYVDGVASGTSLATVSDNGDGAYALQGLPDLQVLALSSAGRTLRVVVDPPSGPAVVRAINVAQAGDADVMTFEVEGNDVVVEDLELIDSNVQEFFAADWPLLPSTVAATDAVELTFSSTLLPSALFVSAIDQWGSPIAVDVSTAANPTMSLTSVGGWPTGRVRIWVDAIGEAGGHAAAEGSFFVDSGGMLTMASGALYEGPNGRFICPINNGIMELRLSQPVGGRFIKGDGTVGGLVDAGNGATFLPVTVTSNSVSDVHPLHGASALQVFAQVVEPAPGTSPSGFGSVLRLSWTADNLALVGNGSQAQIALTLTFNDTDAQSALGTPGDDVIRTIDGTPVTQLSGVVTLGLGNYTDVPASCN